ncbi:MAG: heavy metal translocating P-type ATPase [Oscillospiraceae bacterium]
MQSITLILNGLECPHCADKITRKVSAMEEVSHAELDFVKKKFVVFPKAAPDAALEEKITAEIVKIEPEVRVSRPAEQKPSRDADEDEDEDEELHRSRVIAVAAALVLFGTSFFVPDGIPAAALAIAAYVLAGWKVVFNAVRNILKGQAFDESFLMTVATAGAFALRDFTEGAAVMIFFQVGEIFETLAVQRSRKSITKLMELKPESATVKTPAGFVKKAPEEVEIGDTIRVLAGEKIPLDGTVTSGTSALNTAVLTGEFLPVDVAAGSTVLSGSLNLNGTLELEVTSRFEHSAVAKILDLVQNSYTKKAKAERFITRFARIYTPIVVVAALLLAVVPPLLGIGTFAQWIYSGLVFLVVSCPCALVISVPLSFFSGLGAASSRGILIKGAKTIEALSTVKTIAFDKTGTLTHGAFVVTSIEPAAGVAERDLLERCAAAERFSNHPAAVSIVRKAGELPNAPVPVSAEEIAGKGVRAVFADGEVLCGSRALLTERGVTVNVTEQTDASTAVYVSRAGNYLGRLLLNDRIRNDAPAAVQALTKLSVRTVMLTGDRREAAEKIAAQIGVSDVHAGLLPAGKVELVERLLSEETGTVAFAGDGINDAPVIARADVGIAMGGAGSDIAIEAADVVLMEDSPSKIAQAVKISRRTMAIVRQNIVFAIGIKVAVMLLSVAGLAGLWAAVFADVGVSVLAILNSLRALKTPRE